MLKSKSTGLNILFLGMLACSIVLPYIISPFLKGINTYGALIISQLLAWISPVIYLVVTKTNPFKLIPFKLFNPLAIISIVAMTFCVLPLTTLMNLISMLFVKNEIAGLTTSLSGGSFFLNYFFVAMVPAFSEELLFRGIFFNKLKDKGIFFAAIFAALFFGMLHLNFNQFSYTIVIGFVMAMTLYATGSIFGAMIVHLVLNGNAVIIMALMNKFMAANSEQLGAEIANATNQLSNTPIISRLLSIGVIAIYALIMLVPAVGLYWSTAIICKREDKLKELKADFASLRQKRQTGESRRIVDIFFILCLIFAFGYMIISLF